MYDIFIFHPIPTFCRYISMNFSNGIKLVVKSGQCLYDTQYRQNPLWEHIGTARTELVILTELVQDHCARCPTHVDTVEK